MATAPVAEQAWQAFGSGTSVSITFSQTATSGNLLVTFMTKDDDVLATGPAGWTQQYGFTSNAQIAMQCWVKISDGTETGLTITGDSEVYAVYGLELSGVDATTPIVSNAAQQTGVSSSAQVSISATTSQGIPVLYLAQIGVDRNVTFQGWSITSGIEPIEYFKHEGGGAGDVSQWIGGVFYDPKAPNVTRFQLLSSSEEWGVRGLYITPPLITPIISLPTGTPQTTSPSAAQINSPGFTTDLAQGTAYWYLSSSGTPPTAAVLKAGTGSIQDGSQTVTATGALTFATITGLTPSTSYFLHYIHANATKDSNILSINVSTTGFVVDLTYVETTSRLYTGVNTSFYTTYQNTGTAYAVMTNSATPPTAAEVIAGNPSGLVAQAIDASWGTANPNIFFGTVNAAGGGTVVFENGNYWVHAVLDDPGNSAQSDVATVAVTTRQRFVVDNVVISNATIDSADIDYDITINESTNPRVVVILNQSPTPLTGDDIRNGVWDFDTGDAFQTAADQTVQVNATGLAPLTTYYVHITWYDNASSDYSNDVYWPVLSPAGSFATALNTEELVFTANKAIVITDPLEYAFVRFGVPGRSVNGKTEALVFTASQATVDQGRNVTTTSEQLILTENPANITQGGQSRDVNCTTEVLRLTTNSATVGQGQTANGVTEELLLTTNAATIVKDRPVAGQTEELLLTVNPATVVKNVLREVIGTTEQLELTTNPAVIFRGKNRTVEIPTVTLVWRSNDSTVRRDRLVETPGGNQFLLDVNPAVVGKGQTANGITEQLVFDSGNQATIRRDRDVTGNPESQILIFWQSSATIGRGRTVRTEPEKLLLVPNPATIQRGVTLRPDPEELLLTTNPATIGRGATVRGATEQVILTTNPATIGKTTDRRVTGATEELILAANAANISAGRDVAAGAEILVLRVSRADIRQVFRSIGGGLEFGDRVGVEVISSRKAVSVLSPDPEGATVLTPSAVTFQRCC